MTKYKSDQLILKCKGKCNSLYCPSCYYIPCYKCRYYDFGRGCLLPDKNSSMCNDVKTKDCGFSTYNELLLERIKQIKKIIQ